MICRRNPRHGFTLAELLVVASSHHNPFVALFAAMRATSESHHTLAGFTGLNRKADAANFVVVYPWQQADTIP